MSSESYSYYLAGELFSYKSLIGNEMLANAIERRSEGRFKAVLPQSLELPTHRSKDIRNADYAALIGCDLLLAQFDGPELDSGTVAEFMVAKQLDIPTVLFRSDFRQSGDQDAEGDAWNLMLSHFPRTEGIAVNAMDLYKTCGSVEAYLNGLADQLIQRLNVLIDTTPLIKQSSNEALKYYLQTLVRLGMSNHIAPDELKSLVVSKSIRGLL
ncbi:nucleoside 2-deoxyribosyltransferase [Litoribacillus peritrichatus]|uniref:Nucleoside 2-deoxyribosyltransferase n=1 Tax=Litoribacillus peritrichatus TaxID=718191 RepID=A0ABP7N8I7_9GAMM